MDRRWKQSIDDEIDSRVERFVNDRLSKNRHFKKAEVVAHVLRKPLLDDKSDPKLLRVITEFYVAARVGRRIQRRKAGNREIEGYAVPGEGWRYRAARLMRATEFRAVTREYVERAEASRVKAEFMQEVTDVAEQLGLFDADDFITVAYDQVVAGRGGTDPLAAAA